MVNSLATLHCVGPFLRQKPTAATTVTDLAWCYLYLNLRGEVVIIEWIN
jgi:hypothetical protein